MVDEHVKLYHVNYFGSGHKECCREPLINFNVDDLFYDTLAK